MLWMPGLMLAMLARCELQEEGANTQCVFAPGEAKEAIALWRWVYGHRLWDIRVVRH